MSFQIELCRNDSPPNVVDKTFYVIRTVTGRLREGSSILDPVITFESSEAETAVSAAQFISTCNYAHITSFNRYYYITNIISLNSKLWELHMHVDVLKTYADGIRQQTGIVARQENSYNMMLDDGWFMSYQNPIVTTKLFSNATPFESQEFVLVVAGG